MPGPAPMASCLVAPSRLGKVQVSSYVRRVSLTPAALRLRTPDVRSDPASFRKSGPRHTEEQLTQWWTGTAEPFRPPGLLWAHTLT